jgi:hypothetical protein
VSTEGAADLSPCIGEFRDGLAEAFAILAAREADYLDEMAENDAKVEAVCRVFVPLIPPTPLSW